MKTIAPLLLTGLLISGTALADDCENASTQLELNQCAAGEYQQADKTLNATYKKVMARASEAQREMLKQAQNAWLKVRDADCTFISSGVEGGSVQPMIHSQCLADKTNERNAFLDSLMQCEEGDLSCPLPPQG
ncbi:lysozyme inhibitor LprI family protein [Siccibacter colletis]|uniref:Lysozyme inhibitor LprI family protein n=1 Tax=Siccibacter colletis TaxID=1505757 RepID=A0ABY6JHD5_9ENTR|nr:lysozyme inhibitor LprI family protein [Siccibacter colletis]UYU33250.1 lysozyme inhibitor LprI family protein [Siccibacter colletis]WNN49908.1 lysozyme inhibitor LprI family protein [Siccibacter colletis]